MPTYDVPGVYIEEQTGPGVIAGVGTSTAAFIGPTLSGPINEARRISSFDEFLGLYATAGPDGVPFPYITEPRPFYLAHAVRGFYENGGRQAYIVRAGNGHRASRTVNNQGGQPVFIVEAQKDGIEGNGVTVQTELSARQRVTVGSATVTAIAGPVVTVDNSGLFRLGDIVTEDNTTRATITQILGTNITLDAPLAGLAAGDTLRIANIPPAQATFRLNDVTGLRAGGAVLLSGDDATNPGTTVTDRAVIQSINSAARTVTLSGTAPGRTHTYNLNVAPASAPILISQYIVVVGNASVTALADNTVTVNNAAPFRVGDVVTETNVGRAVITQITTGNVLTLSSTLAGLAVGDTLRLADFTPGQTTIRVADATGLIPGGIVRIEGEDAANPGNPVANPDFAIIQSVDVVNNIVTLRATPPRTNTYNMDVVQANSPTLNPWEFRLIITPPTASGRPAGRFHNLSLESAHPRYIFNKTVLDEIQEFESHLVQINKPPQPPIVGTFPQRLVAPTPATPLAGGVEDQPTALSFVEYQAALDVLHDIDEVNLVCIPDAAADPARLVIQQAMINHCLALKDRFAILDSEFGALPTGPNSVEQHRQAVESEKGFAALYYPWLEVIEPIPSTSPRPLIPRTMFVPPSGHIAGVYARTDGERGVHKAPANVVVRSVVGLERVLSDGQHGPLNLEGIDVLRIFPGTAQVVVWGARTTVQKDVTDWLYVNVRRLLLYIEESIEEGIRYAVFEPNNLALWQKLKRTITEFLTRVWRDGALFGAKPEQAFSVRIDEALNPPSTRALGRLYIEIAVAPVRPAEFIIVRIGLWDGGSEVSEG
jgi:phage tail sheath protein FI